MGQHWGYSKRRSPLSSPQPGVSVASRGQPTASAKPPSSAGGLSAAAGQGPLLSHGEMSVQLLVIALRLPWLRFAHRLVTAFWVFSVRIARYGLTSTWNADQSARQEAGETRGSAARSLASRLRPRVAHVKPALPGRGRNTGRGTGTRGSIRGTRQTCSTASSSGI